MFIEFNTKKFGLFLKTTSLATIVFFLGQIPQPYIAQAQPVSPNAKIEIPNNLGTLESVPVQNPNAPTLIHIQTAHGSFEAQKNIQSILKHLTAQHDIESILLEGGVGELQPDLFHFFPNHPKVNLDIAEDLTHRSEFTGPELFLLESSFNKSSKVKGFGIEDTQAYRDNRKAFQQVLRAKQKTQGFLKEMDMQIESLTAPHLNLDLKQFLRQFEAYETKTLSFIAWLKYLKSQALKRLKIDFDNPIFQKNWPMLIRFYRLESIEPKLNRSLVQEQKTAFLEALKGLGAQENLIHKINTLADFPARKTEITSKLNYAETVQAALELMDVLPDNFDFKPYENFKLYLQFILLKGELQSQGLFQEMERLHTQIAYKLAQTQTEKKLLKLFKDYRLLKKLFALEVIKEEYLSIASREANLQPSAIVKRFEKANAEKRVRTLEFSHLEEMDQLFTLALSFYKGAHKRDDFMAENALSILKRQRQNKAILVTGGFHAEGMKEYFENKGFSYYLVTPRITKITDNGSYHRAMLEQPHPSKSLAPFRGRGQGEGASYSQIENVLALLESKGRIDLTANPAHLVRELIKAFRRNPEAMRLAAQGGNLDETLLKKYKLQIAQDNNGNIRFIRFTPKNVIPAQAGIPQDDKTTSKSEGRYFQFTINKATISVVPIRDKKFAGSAYLNPESLSPNNPIKDQVKAILEAAAAFNQTSQYTGHTFIDFSEFPDSPEDPTGLAREVLEAIQNNASKDTPYIQIVTRDSQVNLRNAIETQVSSESKESVGQEIQDIMGTPGRTVFVVEDSLEALTAITHFLNSGQAEKAGDLVVLRAPYQGLQGVSAEMLHDKHAKIVGGVPVATIKDAINTILRPQNAAAADRALQDLDKKGFIDTTSWPDDEQIALNQMISTAVVKFQLLSEDATQAIADFEENRFKRLKADGISLKVEFVTINGKRYFYPNAHPNTVLVGNTEVVLGGNSPIIPSDTGAIISGIGPTTVELWRTLIVGNTEAGLDPATGVIILSRSRSGQYPPALAGVLTEETLKDKKVATINPNDLGMRELLNTPETYAKSEGRVITDLTQVASELEQKYDSVRAAAGLTEPLTINSAETQRGQLIRLVWDHVGTAQPKESLDPDPSGTQVARPGWLIDTDAKQHLFQVQINKRKWTQIVAGDATLPLESLLTPNRNVALSLADYDANLDLITFHQRTGLAGYINSWGIGAIPRLHDHVVVDLPIFYLKVESLDEVQTDHGQVTRGKLKDYEGTTLVLESQNPKALAAAKTAIAQELIKRGLPHQVFIKGLKVIFILRDNDPRAVFEVEQEVLNGLLLTTLFFAGVPTYPQAVLDKIDYEKHDEIVKKLTVDPSVRDEILNATSKSEGRATAIMLAADLLEKIKVEAQWMSEKPFLEDSKSSKSKGLVKKTQTLLSAFQSVEKLELSNAKTRLGAKYEEALRLIWRQRHLLTERDFDYATELVTEQFPNKRMAWSKGTRTLRDPWDEVRRKAAEEALQELSRIEGEERTSARQFGGHLAGAPFSFTSILRALEAEALTQELQEAFSQTQNNLVPSQLIRKAEAFIQKHPPAKSEGRTVEEIQDIMNAPGRKVLVVEDSLDALQAITHFLNSGQASEQGDLIALRVPYNGLEGVSAEMLSDKHSKIVGGVSRATIERAIEEFLRPQNPEAADLALQDLEEKGFIDTNVDSWTDEKQAALNQMIKGMVPKILSAEDSQAIATFEKERFKTLKAAEIALKLLFTVEGEDLYAYPNAHPNTVLVGNTEVVLGGHSPIIPSDTDVTISGIGPKAQRLWRFLITGHEEAGLDPATGVIILSRNGKYPPALANVLTDETLQGKNVVVVNPDDPGMRELLNNLNTYAKSEGRYSAAIEADIEKRQSAYDAARNLDGVEGRDLTNASFFEQKRIHHRFGNIGETVPSGATERGDIPGFYGNSVVLYLQPDNAMMQRLIELQNKFKETAAFKAGKLLFYPVSSLHYTLGNFTKHQASPIGQSTLDSNLETAKEAVQGKSSFEGLWKGVTVDEAGVIVVQSFWGDGFLELEQGFMDQNLRQRHYPRVDFNFAVTRGALTDAEKDELQKVLNENADFEIGTREVEQVHLVHHQDDMLASPLRTDILALSPKEEIEGRSEGRGQMFRRWIRRSVSAIAEYGQFLIILAIAGFLLWFLGYQIWYAATETSQQKIARTFSKTDKRIQETINDNIHVDVADKDRLRGFIQSQLALEKIKPLLEQKEEDIQVPDPLENHSGLFKRKKGVERFREYVEALGFEKPSFEHAKKILQVQILNNKTIADLKQQGILEADALPEAVYYWVPFALGGLALLALILWARTNEPNVSLGPSQFGFKRRNPPRDENKDNPDARTEARTEEAPFEIPTTDFDALSLSKVQFGRVVLLNEDYYDEIRDALNVRQIRTVRELVEFVAYSPEDFLETFPKATDQDLVFALIIRGMKQQGRPVMETLIREVGHAVPVTAFTLMAQTWGIAQNQNRLYLGISNLQFDLVGGSLDTFDDLRQLFRLNESNLPGLRSLLLKHFKDTDEKQDVVNFMFKLIKNTAPRRTEARTEDSSQPEPESEETSRDISPQSRSLNLTNILVVGGIIFALPLILPRLIVHGRLYENWFLQAITIGLFVGFLGTLGIAYSLGKELFSLKLKRAKAFMVSGTVALAPLLYSMILYFERDFANSDAAAFFGLAMVAVSAFFLGQMTMERISQTDGDEQKDRSDAALQNKNEGITAKRNDIESRSEGRFVKKISSLHNHFAELKQNALGQGDAITITIAMKQANGDWHTEEIRIRRQILKEEIKGVPFYLANLLIARGLMRGVTEVEINTSDNKAVNPHYLRKMTWRHYHTHGGKVDFPSSGGKGVTFKDYSPSLWDRIIIFLINLGWKLKNRFEKSLTDANGLTGKTVAGWLDRKSSDPYRQVAETIFSEMGHNLASYLDEVVRVFDFYDENGRALKPKFSAVIGGRIVTGKAGDIFLSGVLGGLNGSKIERDISLSDTGYAGARGSALLGLQQAKETGTQASIGVDVGGSSVKISFTLDGGQTWEKEEVVEYQKGQSVAELIEEKRNEYASTYNVDLKTLPTVLAVPGVVTSEGKLIALANLDRSNPGTTEALNQYKEASSTLSFANDAEATSYYFLITRNLHDGFFFSFTVGTGLGFTARENGHVIEGPQEAHAPIFHGEGARFWPGYENYGAVEAYINTDYVVTRAAELLQQRSLPLYPSAETVASKSEGRNIDGLNETITDEERDYLDKIVDYGRKQDWFSHATSNGDLSSIIRQQHFAPYWRRVAFIGSISLLAISATLALLGLISIPIFIAIALVSHLPLVHFWLSLRNPSIARVNTNWTLFGYSFVIFDESISEFPINDFGILSSWKNLRYNVWGIKGTHHRYYWVPNEEKKNEITNAIEADVQNGKISEDQAKSMLERLYSFQEFYEKHVESRSEGRLVTAAPALKPLDLNANTWKELAEEEGVSVREVRVLYDYRRPWSIEKKEKIEDRFFINIENIVERHADSSPVFRGSRDQVLDAADEHLKIARRDRGDATDGPGIREILQNREITWPDALDLATFLLAKTWPQRSVESLVALLAGNEDFHPFTLVHELDKEHPIVTEGPALDQKQKDRFKTIDPSKDNKAKKRNFFRNVREAFRLFEKRLGIPKTQVYQMTTNYLSSHLIKEGAGKKTWSGHIHHMLTNRQITWKNAERIARFFLGASYPQTKRDVLLIARLVGDESLIEKLRSQSTSERQEATTELQQILATSLSTGKTASIRRGTTQTPQNLTQEYTSVVSLAIQKLRFGSLLQPLPDSIDLEAIAENDRRSQERQQANNWALQNASRVFQALETALQATYAQNALLDILTEQLGPNGVDKFTLQAQLRLIKNNGTIREPRINRVRVVELARLLLAPKYPEDTDTQLVSRLLTGRKTTSQATLDRIFLAPTRSESRLDPEKTSRQRNEINSVASSRSEAREQSAETQALLKKQLGLLRYDFEAPEKAVPQTWSEMINNQPASLSALNVGLLIVGVAALTYAALVAATASALLTTAIAFGAWAIFNLFLYFNLLYRQEARLKDIEEEKEAVRNSQLVSGDNIALRIENIQNLTSANVTVFDKTGRLIAEGAAAGQQTKKLMLQALGKRLVEESLFVIKANARGRISITRLPRDLSVIQKELRSLRENHPEDSNLLFELDQIQKELEADPSLQNRSLADRFIGTFYRARSSKLISKDLQRIVEALEEKNNPSWAEVLSLFKRLQQLVPQNPTVEVRQLADAFIALTKEKTSPPQFSIQATEKRLENRLEEAEASTPAAKIQAARISAEETQTTQKADPSPLSQWLTGIEASGFAEIFLALSLTFISLAFTGIILLTGSTSIVALFIAGLTAFLGLNFNRAILYKGAEILKKEQNISLLKSFVLRKQFTGRGGLDDVLSASKDYQEKVPAAKVRINDRLIETGDNPREMILAFLKGKPVKGTTFYFRSKGDQIHIDIHTPPSRSESRFLVSGDVALHVRQHKNQINHDAHVSAKTRYRKDGRAALQAWIGDLSEVDQEEFKRFFITEYLEIARAFILYGQDEWSDQTGSDKFFFPTPERLDEALERNGFFELTADEASYQPNRSNRFREFVRKNLAEKLGQRYPEKQDLYAPLFWELFPEEDSQRKAQVNAIEFIRVVANEILREAYHDDVFDPRIATSEEKTLDLEGDLAPSSKEVRNARLKWKTADFFARRLVSWIEAARNYFLVAIGIALLSVILNSLSGIAFFDSIAVIISKIITLSTSEISIFFDRIVLSWWIVGILTAALWTFYYPVKNFAKKFVDDYEQAYRDLYTNAIDQYVLGISPEEAKAKKEEAQKKFKNLRETLAARETNAERRKEINALFKQIEKASFAVASQRFGYDRIADLGVRLLAISDEIKDANGGDASMQVNPNVIATTLLAELYDLSPDAPFWSKKVAKWEDSKSSAKRTVHRLHENAKRYPSFSNFIKEKARERADQSTQVESETSRRYTLSEIETGLSGKERSAVEKEFWSDEGPVRRYAEAPNTDTRPVFHALMAHRYSELVTLAETAAKTNQTNNRAVQRLSSIASDVWMPFLKGLMEDDIEAGLYGITAEEAAIWHKRFDQARVRTPIEKLNAVLSRLVPNESDWVTIADYAEDLLAVKTATGEGTTVVLENFTDAPRPVLDRLVQALLTDPEAVEAIGPFVGAFHDGWFGTLRGEKNPNSEGLTREGHEEYLYSHVFDPRLFLLEASGPVALKFQALLDLSHPDVDRFVNNRITWKHTPEDEDAEPVEVIVLDKRVNPSSKEPEVLIREPQPDRKPEDRDAGKWVPEKTVELQSKPNLTIHHFKVAKHYKEDTLDAYLAELLGEDFPSDSYLTDEEKIELALTEGFRQKAGLARLEELQTREQKRSSSFGKELPTYEELRNFIRSQASALVKDEKPERMVNSITMPASDIERLSKHFTDREGTPRQKERLAQIHDLNIIPFVGLIAALRTYSSRITEESLTDKDRTVLKSFTAENPGKELELLQIQYLLRAGHVFATLGNPHPPEAKLTFNNFSKSSSGPRIEAANLLSILHKIGAKTSAEELLLAIGDELAERKPGTGSIGDLMRSSVSRSEVRAKPKVETLEDRINPADFLIPAVGVVAAPSTDPLASNATEVQSVPTQGGDALVILQEPDGDHILSIVTSEGGVTNYNLGNGPIAPEAFADTGNTDDNLSAVVTGDPSDTIFIYDGEKNVLFEVADYDAGGAGVPLLGRETAVDAVFDDTTPNFDINTNGGDTNRFFPILPDVPARNELNPREFLAPLIGTQRFPDNVTVDSGAPEVTTLTNPLSDRVSIFRNNNGDLIAEVEPNGQATQRFNIGNGTNPRLILDPNNNDIAILPDLADNTFLLYDSSQQALFSFDPTPLPGFDTFADPFSFTLPEVTDPSFTATREFNLLIRSTDTFTTPNLSATLALFVPTAQQPLPPVELLDVQLGTQVFPNASVDAGAPLVATLTNADGDKVEIFTNNDGSDIVVFTPNGGLVQTVSLGINAVDPRLTLDAGGNIAVIPTTNPFAGFGTNQFIVFQNVQDTPFLFDAENNPLFVTFANDNNFSIPGANTVAFVSPDILDAEQTSADPFTTPTVRYRVRLLYPTARQPLPPVELLDVQLGSQITQNVSVPAGSLLINDITNADGDRVALFRSLTGEYFIEATPNGKASQTISLGVNGSDPRLVLDPNTGNITVTPTDASFAAFGSNELVVYQNDQDALFLFKPESNPTFVTFANDNSFSIPGSPDLSFVAADTFNVLDPSTDPFTDPSVAYRVRFLYPVAQQPAAPVELLDVQLGVLVTENVSVPAGSLLISDITNADGDRVALFRSLTGEYFLEATPNGQPSQTINLKINGSDPRLVLDTDTGNISVLPTDDPFPGLGDNEFYVYRNERDASFLFDPENNPIFVSFAAANNFSIPDASNVSYVGADIINFLEPSTDILISTVTVRIRLLYPAPQPPTDPPTDPPAPELPPAVPPVSEDPLPPAPVDQAALAIALVGSLPGDLPAALPTEQPLPSTPELDAAFQQPEQVFVDPFAPDEILIVKEVVAEDVLVEGFYVKVVYVYKQIGDQVTHKLKFYRIDPETREILEELPEQGYTDGTPTHWNLRIEEAEGEDGHFLLIDGKNVPEKFRRYHLEPLVEEFLRSKGILPPKEEASDKPAEAPATEEIDLEAFFLGEEVDADGVTTTIEAPEEVLDATFKNLTTLGVEEKVDPAVAAGLALTTLGFTGALTPIAKTDSEKKQARVDFERHQKLTLKVLGGIILTTAGQFFAYIFALIFGTEVSAATESKKSLLTHEKLEAADRHVGGLGEQDVFALNLALSDSDSNSSSTAPTIFLQSDGLSRAETRALVKQFDPLVQDRKALLVIFDNSNEPAVAMSEGRAFILPGGEKALEAFFAGNLRFFGADAPIARQILPKASELQGRRLSLSDLQKIAFVTALQARFADALFRVGKQFSLDPKVQSELSARVYFASLLMAAFQIASLPNDQLVKLKENLEHFDIKSRRSVVEILHRSGALKGLHKQVKALLYILAAA